MVTMPHIRQLSNHHDTDAGTKDGTNDGSTGKASCWHQQAKITAYQAAYKTAYKTIGDDYQASNADGVANKAQSATNTSVGYTNGGLSSWSNSVRQGQDSEYSSGQAAGAAGDPAADVTH